MGLVRWTTTCVALICLAALGCAPKSEHKPDKQSAGSVSASSVAPVSTAARGSSQTAVATASSAHPLGVRPHPDTPLAAVDLREVEQLWQELIAAVDAADGARIERLGSGCEGGASLQSALQPSKSLAEAMRQGGLLLDRSSSNEPDVLHGAMGPIMPSMTTFTFRRGKDAHWRLCAITPGA